MYASINRGKKAETLEEKNRRGNVHVKDTDTVEPCTQRELHDGESTCPTGWGF